MTKSTAVAIYRPVFNADHILTLTDLVETYRNTAIMSGPESKVIAELYLKLMKEKIKIAAGIGHSYLTKPDSERTRAKSIGPVTSEMLGANEGTVQLTTELSDKDKLAAMSEYEEAKYWLEQDLSFNQVTKEEYDAKLSALKSQYQIG